MDGKWVLCDGRQKSDLPTGSARLQGGGGRKFKPQEEGGATDFIHSDRFILVDRKGRIRGYYNGTDKKQVDKLIADIRKLLRE
jgi:cytochrome oxidase Cu insertion factor (SCO1/SenC/PrrC family)